MKLDGMLFDKYDGRDISVYARTETIDEFIDLFDIELDNGEDYNKVLDSEYAILSRIYGMFTNEEYWYIEQLEHNGEQYINECEVMLVEKGIAKAIDFKKVDYDEIDQFEDVITYVEEVLGDKEEVEKDYIGDWLDDIIEDLFYELVNSEGECAHCIIKKYLLNVYNSSKEDVVNDIINFLEN